MTWDVSGYYRQVRGSNAPERPPSPETTRMVSMTTTIMIIIMVIGFIAMVATSIFR
jgi:hypothetical protein